MAALQSALAVLGPEEFSNVPTAEDDLQEYMTEIFANAEVIIESIPPPPPAEDLNKSANRERSKTGASVASNASEISLSSSRSAPPGSDYEDLQKHWGKPLKLKSQENPLGITVFKAAGKDGRGAWFARRSVHEGLNFSKWAKALEQEFSESIEAGTQPGEGSIRGIGAEKSVEDINLEGKGHLEVYQLSAQFPGPTTPRDFITLLITSSSALKSQSKNFPRHYMIISKPCIHGQCPPRNGFIRGQYESVELIREVPREGHPSSSDAESEGESSDTNPVEWIMVTRSDPGGSVPKFMVERGTPSSICGDAVKFLNWATQKNEEDADKPESLARRRSLPSWETNGHLAGLRESSEDEASIPTGTSTGFLSGASQLLSQGFAAYAPQAVLDRLSGHAEIQSSLNPADEDDVSDSSSTISSASFASAESRGFFPSSVADKNSSSAGVSSRYDKEVQKLNERRKTLDSKISEAREKASAETAAASTKDAEAAKKAKEKQDRELKKEEERYKKDLAKLESRREKEARKEEERRRKAEEKDVSKQNDALKREVEKMKKERVTLLQILGELQTENTRLAAKLGESEKFPALPETQTPTGGDPNVSSEGIVSPTASTEQIRKVLEDRKAKDGRFRGVSVGSGASSKGDKSRSNSELR